MHHGGLHPRFARYGSQVRVGAVEGPLQHVPGALEGVCQEVRRVVLDVVVGVELRRVHDRDRAHDVWEEIQRFADP